MRRRISIRGRVRPSVRPSVRWSVCPSRVIFEGEKYILGASCAVYPALFSPFLGFLRATYVWFRGWNDDANWKCPGLKNEWLCGSSQCLPSVITSISPSKWHPMKVQDPSFTSQNIILFFSSSCIGAVLFLYYLFYLRNFFFFDRNAILAFDWGDAKTCNKRVQVSIIYAIRLNALQCPFRFHFIEFSSRTLSLFDKPITISCSVLSKRWLALIDWLINLKAKNE